MADTVLVGKSGYTAKVRHPVAVPILCFVTLGIYYVYWWVACEPRGRGPGPRSRRERARGQPDPFGAGGVSGGPRDRSPVRLALNGVKRFQRAQEVMLGESTMNGWIVLGLPLGTLVTGSAALIVPGYIQAELNKVWVTQERGGAAAPAGVGRGPAWRQTPPGGL